MIRCFFYTTLFLTAIGVASPCFAGICPSNQRSVGLQDLRTRTIVYCKADSFQAAEQCADYYESQGYVRMTDIPKKTAKYDFLTVDTYPTRRWRNGEVTPRW